MSSAERDALSFVPICILFLFVDVVVCLFVCLAKTSNCIV